MKVGCMYTVQYTQFFLQKIRGLCFGCISDRDPVMKREDFYERTCCYISLPRYTRGASVVNLDPQCFRPNLHYDYIFCPIFVTVFFYIFVTFFLHFYYILSPFVTTGSEGSLPSVVILVPQSFSPPASNFFSSNSREFIQISHFKLHVYYILNVQYL